MKKRTPLNWHPKAPGEIEDSAVDKAINAARQKISGVDDKDIEKKLSPGSKSYYQKAKEFIGKIQSSPELKETSNSIKKILGKATKSGSTGIKNLTNYISIKKKEYDASSKAKEEARQKEEQKAKENRESFASTYSGKTGGDYSSGTVIRKTPTGQTSNKGRSTFQKNYKTYSDMLDDRAKKSDRLKAISEGAFGKKKK